MKISICSYEDLLEEEKDDFYDDGYRSYLVIDWGGGEREIYTDGMEPEDATFARDLSWIINLVEKAYKKGYQESSDEYYG